MKRMITMAAAGSLLVFGAIFTYADSCCGGAAKPADQSIAAAKKAQTECPVLGGAIDRSLYVDANGKRIYVCCASCVATVKADPAKYIKILEDKGIELEKVPAKP